jgi:membrane fusion protein, multidrug efflux system
MTTLRWTCWTAFLVSTLLVIGCKDQVKPGTVQVKRQVVSGVQVSVVQPVQVDEFYESSATVQARGVSAVAGKVMGVVTALVVREGDAVSAGQELLTIDDRDLVQQCRAGEAGHKEALKAQEVARQHKVLAEVTCRRYRQLYEGKAISRQEMDQVETQAKVAAVELERAQAVVVKAQAAVAETRVLLGHTRITAPVTGTVTAKRIEVGSMAVPGMPLLMVEDNSSFKLEINVNESLAGKLTIGMPVNVAIEAIGKELEASITEIVPAVDPISRTFPVKTQLQAPGLKSGLYARVQIPLGKKEVLLVPTTAVVARGQLTGVYRVADTGVITYGLVRTGKPHGHSVEILSGLRAGDRIIVAGVARAIDGGMLGQEP